MATIHDDIESWLAASVHDQLSDEERTALEEHLAVCEHCRRLSGEEITMSNMIQNTLGAAKPDLAFEQRIVSAFRKKMPQRTRFAALLTGLLQSRATQITAVAALMLTLVQVGRLVTGEQGSTARSTPIGLSADSRSAESVNGAAPPPRERLPALTASRVPTASQSTVSNAAGNPPAPAPLKSKALPDSRYQQSVPPETAAPEFTEDAAASGAAENSAKESDLYVSEEPGSPQAAAVDANRKLVRNAQVEIEVARFDEAVQKITAFAGEMRGYVATSSSEKQENGKLRGEVVVKVLPETLDAFLQKLRGLGDVKNQALGSEDVTKQYFDTDSRLKNARLMEQRLVDILKTKTGKVSDLLEVEKELGRVREQIEQMQGALKYLDAQVQFATVTITLSEKDMDVPAAFLLKRRADLALFSNDVEKTFAEVKGVIEGAKAQLSSSTLDRDSAGEATARLVLLILPEEADVLIDRIKGMGRVQNYSEQTDRVAQGGSGMSDTAKVERDKVELSVTISRNEQEPALQRTSLRILTPSVNENVAKLKASAAASNAEIRSSSFSRNPDGQEFANITLRVPMKNYEALMNSFDPLGKVKDVSVHREDRRGQFNEETAPADITVQVYSEGNIVSEETGIIATIRRTLGQGAAAVMWSLRMIGVAIAFLAPWALLLAFAVWTVKRVSRARAARRAKADAAE